MNKKIYIFILLVTGILISIVTTAVPAEAEDVLLPAEAEELQDLIDEMDIELEENLNKYLEEQSNKKAVDNGR